MADEEYKAIIRRPEVQKAIASFAAATGLGVKLCERHFIHSIKRYEAIIESAEPDEHENTNEP